MDLHQNARLTFRCREALARKILIERLTLNAAAAAFNVSRKTASKWLRRYRNQGLSGLRDHSSRPLHSPRRTSSELVAQVIALRRQLCPAYHIAQATRLSPATVSRILQRAHLNRWRHLHPAPPVVRYEHPAPGDLLHLDIKGMTRYQQVSLRGDGRRRGRPRFAGGKPCTSLSTITPASPLALDEYERVRVLKHLLSGSAYAALRIQFSAETQHVLDTFAMIRRAREEFGKQAISCYIISMACTLSDLLEVQFFCKEIGISGLPIVPLFETIDDLRGCAAILDAAFTHPNYHAWLATCNNRQQVMLGYSDSSKDGGILLQAGNCIKPRSASPRLASVMVSALRFFMDGAALSDAVVGQFTKPFWATP